MYSMDEITVFYCLKCNRLRHVMVLHRPLNVIELSDKQTCVKLQDTKRKPETQYWVIQASRVKEKIII